MNRALENDHITFEGNFASTIKRSEIADSPLAILNFQHFARQYILYLVC